VSESIEERFAAWSQLAEDGEFEPALAALEESVALLEDGGLSLATMTACYELGLRLSRRCSTLLREAELRISLLDQSLADDDAGGDVQETLVRASFLDDDE
jgi:exodeoxyribonuclease VII small subunit